MDYLKIFNSMYPGFFDNPAIKEMSKNQVFSELMLDLRNGLPCKTIQNYPENITFGEYKGDISPLKEVVCKVKKSWVQYFKEQCRIFCAFDQDTVTAFCLLDDHGTQNGLDIAGIGCVGTIPKYREQGIGLEMVKKATALLKKENYDAIWIHYTHIENWYQKLGYKTVLKWNSDGIIP